MNKKPGSLGTRLPLGPETISTWEPWKDYKITNLIKDHLGPIMVVPAGLEPATSNEAWILNPLCKPIPPGNH